MKTISLLILLCSVVWGQGYKNPDKGIEQMKQIAESIKHLENMSTSVSRVPTWEEKFIENWEEYAKECWADSTFVKSYKDLTDDQLLRYNFGTKYLHGKKTIEGFVEFLRKKIKGGER